VVAQYYTFFRLGHAGFRVVQQACRDVATFLSGRIGAMPEFDLVSRGDALPVFAFTTRADVTSWDVFALSRALRERGWQVPAYSFPANREDLDVLRVVCRNGFGYDLAATFLEHLGSAVRQLTADDRRGGRASGPSAFHH
jgi:glutamate decarboxylase